MPPSQKTGVTSAGLEETNGGDHVAIQRFSAKIHPIREIDRHHAQVVVVDTFLQEMTLLRCALQLSDYGFCLSETKNLSVARSFRRASLEI